MIIRKLPKEVINKIAAGEVIQRPYNVIKELVENAIDAEATMVRVNIREGGLQLIEVVDNGKGIRKGDFPLLCERFATSKIAELADLETIQSFGFRGEALASLSYVSELEVTSKHREESLGYRCSFRDEKMLEDPQPLSVNTGTKIRAGQLFGSLETRRSSLNPVEEKKRIVKLVGHFALHYHYVKFSLQSEKGSELSTDFRNYKVSESKMKVFQSITKLPYDKFTYLPKQLLEDAKLEAIITKLNTVKGKVLLLNVNNRIVESPEITRAVERAYSECYQSIHEDNETFFVYLSIDLDPRKIDCNQHPSKKVIGFFSGDKLFENVYGWVLQHIKEESSIKNIATNIGQAKGKVPFSINRSALLGFKSQSQVDNAENQPAVRPEREELAAPKTQQPKQLYAYQKNRTDSLQMPLNFYVKASRVEASETAKYLKYTLRAEEGKSRGDSLRKFFQEITYVGCFNLNYIFVHMVDRLYMMNVLPFLESFVREWLAGPNNRLLVYETLDRYEQMSLRQIIAKFAKNKRLEHRINVSALVEAVLINKDLIYKEYGIAIQENQEGTDAVIVSYPVLERFMADCMIDEELAYFLCRLFSKAPTEEEREGYFVDYLVSLFQEREGGEEVKLEEEARGELSPMNDKYSEYFRDKVIPLLKTRAKDYREINYGSYLTEMMNLKDVYKIFERC